MFIENANMTVTLSPSDRSRDLSQPLDRLGPDESLKASSDHLRGTISQGLLDRLTGAVAPDDTKLMKFHGLNPFDLIDNPTTGWRAHHKTSSSGSIHIIAARSPAERRRPPP